MVEGIEHKDRLQDLEPLQAGRQRCVVRPSARPARYANQLPDQIERLIVEARRGKPHWGARKIRELLVRKLAGEVRIPARSTVHAVLDRHGLVKRSRQRRRMKAEGTQLSAGVHPNDLWCADFKGEFKTGNGRYCYQYLMRACRT